MRGSVNAVPKYNDKTRPNFPTIGIKMPEINHKAHDKSRGIHTRRNRRQARGQAQLSRQQQTQTCAAAKQQLLQLSCA